MIDCVFCRIVLHQEPAFIIYEDKLCLAFLDKYPKSRGHLQLIPKKHYKWIYEIPQIGKFFVVAKALIRVIIPVLEADHVSLATFGQQIEHAHLWIVPQYKKGVKISEFGRSIGQDDQLKLANRLRTALTKGGA